MKPYHWPIYIFQELLIILVSRYPSITHHGFFKCLCNTSRKHLAPTSFLFTLLFSFLVLENTRLSSILKLFICFPYTPDPFSSFVSRTCSFFSFEFQPKYHLRDFSPDQSMKVFSTLALSYHFLLFSSEHL